MLKRFSDTGALHCAPIRVVQSRRWSTSMGSNGRSYPGKVGWYVHCRVEAGG